MVTLSSIAATVVANGDSGSSNGLRGLGDIYAAQRWEHGQRQRALINFCLTPAANAGGQPKIRDMRMTRREKQIERERIGEREKDGMKRVLCGLLLESYADGLYACVTRWSRKSEKQQDDATTLLCVQVVTLISFHYHLPLV